MNGIREIDLRTANVPRSMRRAISRSPSRVSSGTVRISRRYRRMGSLVLSTSPGQAKLRLLCAFGSAIGCVFVVQVLLVRVDDLDARADERIEQIVKLVRGGEVHRQ